MDFKRFSSEAVEHIDQELKRLLGEWRSEVGKTSASLLPLVDKFIKACEGGKRIRGTLVKLGYGMTQSVIPHLPALSRSALSSRPKCEAEGMRDPYHIDSRLRGNDRGRGNDIFKIAAAYEIFHTAILAHDDVIDESPLRRGQPSLYQALGGDHYGTSQAICLGDAGFFLATKVIAESNFPDRLKNKALQWVSKIMLDTVVGEMLDIVHGDVLSIMKLKTAKYTISGPLVLGGILSGAGEELVGVFGKFGENLGIAFQIQDDILGVFGSEAEIGKSITSDMEEGKVTILFIEAFKNANSQQRKNLEKLYGRGKIDKREAKVLRQIFEETGALDLAKKQVIEYSNQAKKSIPRLTKDTKMSTLLEQMVEYLVERSK